MFVIKSWFEFGIPHGFLVKSSFFHHFPMGFSSTSGASPVKLPSFDAVELVPVLAAAVFAFRAKLVLAARRPEALWVSVGHGKSMDAFLTYPDAPCMVYLPTFGWFLGQMLVNIPNIELADSFHMAMDQYLEIPFLGGWTSIYQLFWCELQGYYWFWHTYPYANAPWCWYKNLQNWVILDKGKCWYIFQHHGSHMGEGEEDGRQRQRWKNGRSNEQLDGARNIAKHI